MTYNSFIHNLIQFIMVQKITAKVDSKTVNAEKFAAMVKELIELGVFVSSEIMYDDSDEELTAKVKEITEAYLK